MTHIALPVRGMRLPLLPLANPLRAVSWRSMSAILVAMAAFTASLTAMTPGAATRALPRDPPAARASPCWQPTAVSEALVARLRTLATTSDPTDVAMRTSLQLPAVPDTAVQVVTDDGVCAQAVAAHQGHRPHPDGGALERLLVVRVGSTRYVVFDGYSSPGEFSLYDVYRSQFAYIGSLAG